MLISVAIPCYKSEKTITGVVNEIKEAILAREGNDYQIILVNDYPNDNTFEVIRELCREDSKVIGVNLSKNYGQNSAKLAAIPYFTGDVLVYMDDDGQHPADAIYRLVDKIQEGYDGVYAHFPNKSHSAFKKFTSNVNSKMMEINGTKPKNLHISSFCAYSKTAAMSLINYKSPFPSIGGFLGTVVSNYTEIDVEHRKRAVGSSNYTLGRLLKLWLNVFTNFSVVPLRIAAFSGVFFALCGFVYGIIIIVKKLIYPEITAGFTTGIALQLFIGGIIMILLGLIGEYIGRIYMTISNMPQYTVREEINAENKNNILINQ